MLWVNGQAVTGAYWNRGLAYGDGLFETIAFRNHQAFLWEWHMRRLKASCDVLQLQLPDVSLLLEECQALLSDARSPNQSGVIRMTIVRADTPGHIPGYGSTSETSMVERLLRYKSLPTTEVGTVKLKTAFADLRLAEQPKLAGLKHLNRLEQVMAAREATSKGLDELVMLDTKGRVIEAISSNLLVFDGEQWSTPALHYSGVAGVMRQWLLDQQLITIKPMQSENIIAAKGLALCNAVRGIQAIVEHQGQHLRSSEFAVANLKTSMYAAGISQ